MENEKYIYHMNLKEVNHATSEEKLQLEICYSKQRIQYKWMPRLDIKHLLHITSNENLLSCQPIDMKNSYSY